MTAGDGRDAPAAAQVEAARTAGGTTEIIAADADTRTPAFYLRRAADVRAVGALAEATAVAAETAFADFGSVGVDFGQRIALRLRECAREASWTAAQLDVYADEASDVGRTDEVANSARLWVVEGGAA